MRTFVTAMMAFFLLMWLISMTTQEQKVGLAEFFAPSTLAFSNEGRRWEHWAAKLWTVRQQVIYAK